MKNNTVFIIIILLFLGNCKKLELEDLDDSLFTEGIVIPLAHAELKAEDIFSLAFENTSIMIVNGENGEISFSIKDTITSLGLNDFVKIEPNSISVDIPFNLFNFQREYVTSMNVPLSSSMIDVNTGKMSYSLKFTASDFIEPLDLAINIPNINPIEGGKNIELVLDGNQELIFDFDNETFTPLNEMLSFNITARPSRQTGVYGNQTGNILVELSDISLHSVTGTFNGTNTSLDSTSLNIGYNDFAGLSDNTPTLHLIFSNELPFSGLVDYDIYGISSQGEALQLSHPDLLISESSGITSKDTISITEDNSNISEVFMLSPEQFSFKGDVNLNPISNTEIEISENDSITMEYLLEFPSKVKFSTYLESDFLTVTESEMINDLSAATLSLEVYNGFPLQAGMIINFYDDSETLIDSIEFPVIEANATDDNGFVSSITIQYVNRELTSQELEHLKTTRKLVIEITMDTDDKKVGIRNDYQFDFKVALKAKN